MISTQILHNPSRSVSWLSRVVQRLHDTWRSWALSDRTSSRTTSVLDRPVSRQYVSSQSFSIFDISTYSRTLSFRVAILTSLEFLCIVPEVIKMTRHLVEQVSLDRRVHFITLVRGQTKHEYIRLASQWQYIGYLSRCTAPFNDWGGAGMTQDFLQRLEELLEATPQISKEETAQAIALIKQKSYCRVSSQGKCFQCHKQIEYRQPPAPVHLKRGDKWLNEKIASWNKKLKIEVDLSKQTINRVNELAFDTVVKYICTDCWRNDVVVQARKVLSRDLKVLQDEREKIQKKETGILKGEIRATPAKAYWILREKITEAEIQELKDMPYQQFLNTFYWKTIRNYIFYKRGTKCHLCPSTQYLQVHHRTYEHRGFEISYLEDLIVLCRDCHARHHDKLEQGGTIAP